MVNTLTGLTVQTVLHRYFPALYLVLIALLGCVAGWLVTLILGSRLTLPVENVTSTSTTKPAVEQQRPLSDYQVILDRDIFNPTGAATAVLSDNDAAMAAVTARTPNGKQAKAAISGRDLVLVGTIAAGLDSLAVLREGKETHIYRLGDEIADGVTVEDISRNTVILSFPNGSRQVLTISTESEQSISQGASRPHADAASKTSGVRQVGENRFVIPKEVADQARNNVNELMKQARMEPHIVDGQTRGFVVRMIQPRSFLAQLGLRRGDVLMAINNVPLDSPEKALQIFQQLREARDIKVDLLRHDRPLTLEYQTD